MAKKNQEQEQTQTNHSGPELAKRTRVVRKAHSKGEDVSEALNQLIEDHREYLRQNLSEADRAWGRQHLRVLRGLLPED